VTTFDDGPARGAHLNLGRLPFFLRVTRDRKTGAIDALNEAADKPRETEELFVYMLTHEPGRAFIDGSKFRGLVSCGNYRLTAQQPTDAEMRDPDAWHRWCVSRPEFPPAWAKQP
jgi:hypothetical protein